MSGPVMSSLKWLLSPMRLVLAGLWLLLIASSIGVVGASHETRAMYRSLQELQAERDDLDSNYEKLLLEQSAWANNTRVDQVAREELGMVPPDSDEIVIVRVQ